MADDQFYDILKESISEYGNEVLGGKKGITDKEIDNVSNYASGLVKRLNEGEVLDMEKEFLSMS